ncbi:zf-HC2 domain-containing protein [Desulfosporosinus sp. OT]|uniref:anti-sigma factor family protein n=1 Tax=Desulfosporosinus sp. OT TaxID=913865 RepID=UPI0002239E5D|nr:zf-HC2 domain-containing protein [Desulfosporosinus sp. OT]EGW39396.1 hypothetical protein DOT_2681 [Desulfosporosinus sp. OT]
MTCYRSQNSWHSYVKNSLDEAELHEMTAHLLLCSECRSLVSAIRETAGTFANDRVILTPPLEIKLNVMMAIDKHKYKKSTSSSHLFELKNWGLSMLAAGLLLFALNLTSLVSPLASNHVTDLNTVLGKQMALPFHKMSQVTQAVLREIDSFTTYQPK